MFGKYILHEKIGDGGYSSVYKCTDDIGIRYAVKCLPKDKNKRVRVQQEIQVMKMLKKSPKIVRFVDAGEDDESYYIVQEWCRGGDVKSYLSNQDTYVENSVASVARGALRGLIHMHELGIIHCDIKAGNIMVGDTSADADVKVGDMGTAIIAELGEEVEVDQLVGTPWFMSPENLSYHVKSDIWSLGVMVYQLLSGNMPFNDHDNPYNPSVAKIWKGILYEEPKMTSRKWNDVSEEAKDFVRKCLTKDYKQRPSAVECLSHEWLTKTDCNDRFRGTPLKCQPFKFEDSPLMNAKTIANIELE